MALPSSGALSLLNIRTQFGAGTTAGDGLAEYYAGGSLVSAGTRGINGAIPTSGTIRVSDFYGAPRYNMSVTVGYSGTPGVDDNYGYQAAVMGSISGTTLTPAGTITGIYTQTITAMGTPVNFTWLQFSTIPGVFSSLTIGTGGTATTWTYGVGGVVVGNAYRWAGSATALNVVVGTVVPCTLIL